MILAHWLKSLVRRRGNLASVPVAVGRRRRQRLLFSAAAESLETRTLLAATGPELIEVFANNDGSLGQGARIDLRTQQNPNYAEAPREITLRFSEGQSIDPSTLGAITVLRSNHDGDFNDTDNITVTPGFVSVGTRPNEVVIRFANTLPDDTYQILVRGTGSNPLRNSTGQAYGGGRNESVVFRLDLAPQVEGVVALPILRDRAIRITNPSAIRDGDRIAIQSGGAVLSLEFDRNGVVTPGAIGVALTASETVTSVRDKVIAAFNSITRPPGDTGTLGRFDVIAFPADSANDTIALQGNSFSPMVRFVYTDATGMAFSGATAPAMFQFDGGLRQSNDRIVVYFTPTDNLDLTLAENVAYYRVVNSANRYDSVAHARDLSEKLRRKRQHRQYCRVVLRQWPDIACGNDQHL